MRPMNPEPAENKVDEKEENGTTLEERRARADRMLEGYRERRRRRRADDTFFGSAACLLAEVEEGIGEPERSRRLSEIMEDAEADGMSRDLAERIYEVAREEGIDPALGYELVRCGLGVVPPEEGLSNAPEQPSSDKYLPQWMFPPIPTDTVLRERMLRFSFRRLRRLLEEHREVGDAFRAFADEPDVASQGY
jgi:hypothetical protein